MTRNLGKFVVDAEMIEDDPFSVRLILRDVIVVRAEMMFMSDCVEYVGLHPDFEEVPLGREAPRYTARITRTDDPDDDGISLVSVEWARQEDS